MRGGSGTGCGWVQGESNRQTTLLGDPPILTKSPIAGCWLKGAQQTRGIGFLRVGTLFEAAFSGECLGCHLNGPTLLRDMGVSKWEGCVYWGDFWWISFTGFMLITYLGGCLSMRPHSRMVGGAHKQHPRLPC